MKLKNLLDKKIIFSLTCLMFLFSILALKVSAANIDVLQNTSFTGPINGKVTTSQDLNFSFTFTAPILTTVPTSPNLNYNVYFQPYCDGVKPNLGANYIYNAVKVNAQKKTITESWTLDSGICPVDTKVFRWTLSEVNSAQEIVKTYVDTNFTFALNTNYTGYYYIYKTLGDGVYTFATSSRFTTEALCTAGADNHIAQNSSISIYTGCKYYDSIPALDSAEYANIKVTSDSGTGDDTYTLLAPLSSEMKTAPTNVGDYFNLIFKIAIGLCGALAVVMIIINGITYMGDESIFAKTEAKKKIIAAIFGLLIALGSYALLNTINPDLLKGNVNIAQVSASIDTETETSPWTESAVISGTTTNCPEGYTNVSTSGNPSTINVCKSVSNKVESLLSAAKKVGITLSGYGSRSYTQQVSLRAKNNCPDIYNSPSIDCNPPTARPGRSKHESGKAIDFTCNGQSMTASGGTSSVCYKWLNNNAKTYGFYNLAGESWHWSDDGH